MSYVEALVDIKVGFSEALMVSPNGAGHAGPWLLDAKNTFNIVALNLLARDRINDGGFDTEERERCAAGLGGSYTSKRSNDVGTSLSLPIGLYRSQHPRLHY